MPSYGAALYDRPNATYKTRNCDNCMMWVSSGGGECQIHKPGQATPAKWICGYWVGGKPMDKRIPHPGIKYVEARHSGLEQVPKGTRCSNCDYYVADKKLCRAIGVNGKFAPVEPNACCALWARVE